MRSDALTHPGRRTFADGRRSWLLPLLAFSLVATACGGGGGGGAQASPTTLAGNTFSVDAHAADPGPPRQGGSLAVGLESETSGWNPSADRWGSSGSAVAFSIFDTIARYDAQDEPQPSLAAAITPNTDFTQWTIAVRPGVTFHNGQPVDAVAVAANLRAQKSSALFGNVFVLVESIDTSDDLTVVVTMSSPWSTYPDLLTGQTGAVAAPEQLESADPSAKPIGSGPFVFDEWNRDSSLRVSKNANYWQAGKPHLDSIQFEIITDHLGRSQALDSGGADLIQVSDPTQLLALEQEAASAKIQMHTGSGADTSEAILGLNTAAPPFDDRLARRVLATGIDTERLSKDVYQGIFPPAKGPFTADSPNYVDTSYPSFDPGEARRLVDKYSERHGGEPLTFTLKIGTQAEVLAVAQAIQSQMADIGVTMAIEGVEPATLLTQGLTGDFQATYYSLFGGRTLDREHVLMVDSTVAPIGQVSLNFTRNTDPVLTAALQSVRQTNDPAQQFANYTIIQEQMANDLNFIFLVHTTAAVAYRNNVHGLVDPTLPDGQPARRSLATSLADIWRSN